MITWTALILTWIVLLVGWLVIQHNLRKIFAEYEICRNGMTEASIDAQFYMGECDNLKQKLERYQNLVANLNEDVNGEVKQTY